MKLATLTLNQYDRLDQLLFSAERGSVKPSGYIIVDNGDAYDIRRAESIIQGRVPIDFVKPGKNVGVAAGWNIILERDLADTDSIGIVISNDDIILGHETFGQLVEGLQHSDFVGCAGGWALFAQSHHCTKTVGWYDENFINAYYEDCDYYLRLHAAEIDILDLGWGSGVSHSGEATTKGATPEQLDTITKGRAANYHYFILKWGSGSPRWGNPHVQNFPEAFNGKPPPGWNERLSDSALKPDELIAVRWDVVNNIAKRIGAKRYLEIGVENGSMMERIDVQEKWGVDPFPTPGAVKASTVFVARTSNEFFNGIADKMEAKFDLVFIDGDHRAEQVYGEVQSAIKNLSKDGIICLHDCCPFNKEMQEVPLRSGTDWTGDVWKAIARIHAEGEHLVRVINSDFGVAIVLPNQGRHKPYVKLVERLNSLTWEDFKADREGLIGLIQPWEWQPWLTEQLERRHAGG